MCADVNPRRYKYAIPRNIGVDNTKNIKMLPKIPLIIIAGIIIL